MVSSANVSSAKKSFDTAIGGGESGYLGVHNSLVSTYQWKGDSRDDITTKVYNFANEARPFIDSQLDTIQTIASEYESYYEHHVKAENYRMLRDQHLPCVSKCDCYYDENGRKICCSCPLYSYYDTKVKEEVAQMKIHQTAAQNAYNNFNHGKVEKVEGQKNLDLRKATWTFKATQTSGHLSGSKSA